jgi:ribonuclease J
MGMSKENIFVMDIGEVLEVSDKTAARNGTVPAGQLLVDGLGIGDVGSVVLRDRKHLAEDGLIIAAAGVSFENGGIMLMSGPEIISRGFVFVREADDLIESAKAVVRGALYECEQKGTSDWQYIRNKIKDDLKEHIWQKTKRNPMIFPVLLEV